jgi:beta-glucosidase
MTRSKILLLAAALVFVGCAVSEKDIGKTDNAPVKASGVKWPAVKSAVVRDEAVESRVDTLLEKMSQEEKVGQIIQPELRHITPEDIKKYHVGSVLNGGGAFPNDDKYAKPGDWVALADTFYHASMDDSDGGVAIPIIWGTDAVHGHNNVIGATIFPHNIGLGAMNNPDLIEKIGAATAREIAVTGIDWSFAPTLAVVRDDRWGRTYESYSEDPAIVKAYGGRMVKGLQGEANSENFMAADRVVSTAKHFIADGGTQGGVDRANADISEKELRDIHAAGYFSALAAGSQTVMASFNSWQGDTLHGHKYLLTDVLKEKMGFDGFVVGDWSGHEFVPGCTRNRCAQSINAGLDMFMAPNEDWKVLYANTLEQVNKGEISQARLDDAVRRILRVKVRAGLFEKGDPSKRSFSGKENWLGAPEHRDIARQAVRESLVLLKNKNQLLPLKANAKVLVTGDGADDIGKQSGGWTISWQGTGNSNSDFPNGVSIFAGIQEKVHAAGGEAWLSEDGSYQQKPDVAIVVFGEDPYAEMQGDIQHLKLPETSGLELMKKFRADNIPVVALFITGRPLWVNRELNAADAFMVVWLPGSEGAGVADVIIRNTAGEIDHPLKGKLSFSWPAMPDQTPLNVGDKNYAPLFPFGYGLSWGESDTLSDNLSEDAGSVAADTSQELRIFDNRPLEPWQLIISDQLNNHLAVTGSSAQLENISLRAMDRHVQEDSRQITWRTGQQSRVSFTSHQRTDLTHWLAEDAVLQLEMRVDKPASSSVLLSMYCGQDCQGGVDIYPALQEKAIGEWFELAVPLSCFASEQFRPEMVLSPLILATVGDFTLSLHDVRITKKAANFSCG